MQCQGVREPTWPTVLPLAQAFGVNCLAFVDDTDSQHGQRVLLDNSGKVGRTWASGLLIVNRSLWDIRSKDARRTSHGEAAWNDGG
jgi:hypothetical protein